MLDYNPMRRITADEALRHEYWQQEPVPGPNCFVPEGRPAICTYPKRGRTPMNAAELKSSGAAAAGGGGGAGAQHAQPAPAPVQQGKGRKRKSESGHR
jgi:cyclin-dependent kinase 8/11